MCCTDYSVCGNIISQHSLDAVTGVSSWILGPTALYVYSPVSVSLWHFEVVLKQKTVSHPFEG